MRVLIVLFYAGFLILIGLTLFLFSVGLTFELLQPQFIENLANSLQAGNTRLIIALSGLALMLASFYFAQVILGRLQREKTIAFTTPAGQVTISLSAVEDLIKHFTYIFPEIKELRPDVIASKKGVFVNLKVVLNQEANLPDLTARLQEVTKSKIQEVLGIDEEIIIRIHIAKIISHEDRDKRKKEIDKDESAVPYQGYGRA
ncbi:MAG: alkaline shock response membrane anchor protein AmaP [Candidatus Omnitrophota bacterium]|nr:alkaline shock response membrane anchor protein AmaP [Candidatus Omnitrophota bacterium]